MAIDYINTLGAGAGFNTKEIVSALVEAETTVSKTRIERKIENNDAEISALATGASALVALQESAKKLNDATDFNILTSSNTQVTAFSITANSTANTGVHEITVASVARAQRTNITPDGANHFSSSSQLLNSGSSFDIAIAVGATSTITTNISVSTPTPQGIVDAVNAANFGVTAQLVDKGTSGTEYIIQLVSDTGSEQAYSVTPSVNSLLNSATPVGQTAADASLSVNGVSYTRAKNSIEDIIPGVTLDLSGPTDGAANIAVSRDTAAVKAAVQEFAEQFNATKSFLRDLNDRESGGALAGDSVIRRHIQQMQTTITAFSSTPGDNIKSVSDIGVSISKTGELEVSETKLDAALSTGFSEIRKIFSADTTDQTELGDASRGIAGDLSALITALTGSGGYYQSRPDALSQKNTDLNADLTEVQRKIEKLTERYTRQFAAMNAIIDEMNNTKDNLISSFENLPFTNKD